MNAARALQLRDLVRLDGPDLAQVGTDQVQDEIQSARTANIENPEAAIAYPEAFVRDLHRECGLELREPLRYGARSGRPDGMSGQDVVIAVKSADRYL
ncbi:hypothetical protein [[Mycobacterium] zoologicum]|uniref:hypothetical protein n=1 Tax=[Mycobacterium] zoologicum TaxID=2872311 RepID=UPI002E7A7E17|nr:hypothetical protein [Mycolicibacter sp. MYC123]